MGILITGIALFIAIHLVPWHQGLRSSLIEKIGLNPYKGLYSLFALLGLVLIIFGKANAEFQHLWVPPTWGRSLTFPMMLLALMLLVAANLPTNIKRLTRHPMLWAVFLWSVAHLSANGDVASLILFGSFGLYALLAMLSANKRGAVLQTKKIPLKNDLLVVAIGLFAFGGFLVLHPYLFKVAII